jgi:predicted dehydrogenase
VAGGRLADPVALIGCGRWGRHVLRDLLALGARVVVVAPSEATRRYALEAGAEATRASIDQLPAVAGAVVVTPTTTHAAVVDELLGLDVPLFVEKPLTEDPDGAARLAAQAPERLFVMHKWRYHPGVEALSAIARSEELGPVEAVRTTRVGWGNPHGDVDGIWMLAPHDISIVLELLGDIPSPRWAAAERVGATTTGLVGVLGDAPWAAIELSIAHTERRREIRLVCRDGVAVLANPYADHVALARGELIGAITREEERRPISNELPLLRELRAFLGHLAGGRPPRSSAGEAAAEVAAIGGLRALAGLDAGVKARHG